MFYLRHSLFHDVRILRSCLSNLEGERETCAMYLKEGNCIDHVVSEGTREHIRVMLEGGFPQQQLELLLKNVSDFMYERI